MTSSTADVAADALQGNECIEQARGALPPGKYTLKVDLPWSDPDPETPGSTETRRFHAPRVVTPCVPASCTFADGHGGTTESSCGLCSESIAGDA